MARLTASISGTTAPGSVQPWMLALTTLPEEVRNIIATLQFRAITSGASAHPDGIRAHSAARYFRLSRLVADLEKHSEAYTALREACYSANPRATSAAAHELECTNMTASRSLIAM